MVCFTVLFDRQYISLRVWTATDDYRFMLFWHKYCSLRYCNRHLLYRIHATKSKSHLLEKTNLSILKHKKICKSVNNLESAIDNGNKVTVTFLIMATKYFFFIATLGSFDIWTGWWLGRHDWSLRPVNECNLAFIFPSIQCLLLLTALMCVLFKM